MDQVLLFIVIGLAPGALIGGLAISAVLTYRGSGAINIATGSVAMMAGYTYFGLRDGGYLFVPRLDTGDPWSLWPAVAAAIATSALLGVLLELLVLAPLRDQSPLTKLLATLGVYLTCQALVILCFASDIKLPAPVLGALGENTIDVVGIPLPADGLEVTIGVLVLAVVLTVVYRTTRFGLATRAAAENDTNAALLGLSAPRLSMTNTVLGSVIAGTVGVLVSPSTGLDPFTIPNVVVPALAAALLARFTSFSIAAVVGVGLGVGQSLVKYAQAQSWFPTVDGYQIPGVADLLFFLVIVVALFLRGSTLPTRASLTERGLPPAVPPVRLLRPALLVAVAALAYFLLLPYGYRQAGINTMIGVVVSLSLVLVIGYIGQASIVQVALAGVAGFVVSKVALHGDLGFPFGPVLGILAATGLGVVVAFSALRVRGVSLVIVTMSAAVTLERFVFQNPVWGAGTQGSAVPPPRFLGVDLSNSSPLLSDDTLPSPFFGLLVTAATVLIALFVSKVRLTNLGHRFLAVRSNERAAAAAGIDVRRTKLLAFALSSAIAGAAGVMYAYNFGSVSAARFSLPTALSVIAFAYVGGIATTRGAVVAGTMVIGGMGGYVILDHLSIPHDYQLLLGGLALVATIVLKPEGIAGGPLRSQVAGRANGLDRLLARARSRSGPPGASGQATPTPLAPSARSEREPV